MVQPWVVATDQHDHQQDRREADRDRQAGAQEDTGYDSEWSHIERAFDMLALPMQYICLICP